MDGEEHQQDESDSTAQQDADFNAFDTPTDNSSEADAGQTTDKDLKGDADDKAGSEGKDPAAPPPEKKGFGARLAAVKEILSPSKNKENTNKKPKADGAAKPGQPGDAAAADGEKPGEKQGRAADQQADPNQEVPEEVAKHPAYVRLQAISQELHADAVAHQDTIAYMQENQIPVEDYEQGMFLLALSKKDPQAFVGELRKVLDQYETALNIRLPADLQARVDAGEMTEEAAKEFNAERVKNLALQGQNRQKDTHITRDAQQKDITETNNIVNRFFEETAKSDPHVVGKAKAIAGEMLRLQQRWGAPQNAQQKLQLVQAAYKSVNEMMGAERRPAKPTNKNPPPAGHGPSGNAIPANATFKTKMNAQVKNILRKQG